MVLVVVFGVPVTQVCRKRSLFFCFHNNHPLPSTAARRKTLCEVEDFPCDGRPVDGVADLTAGITFGLLRGLDAQRPMPGGVE